MNGAYLMNLYTQKNAGMPDFVSKKTHLRKTFMKSSHPPPLLKKKDPARAGSFFLCLWNGITPSPTGAKTAPRRKEPRPPRSARIPVASGRRRDGGRPDPPRSCARCPGADPH